MFDQATVAKYATVQVRRQRMFKRTIQLTTVDASRLFNCLKRFTAHVTHDRVSPCIKDFALFRIEFRVSDGRSRCDINRL
jgi:hypothetical protein